MDVQVIIIHCFIPEDRFLKQQNYCHTSNTSLNLLPVRSQDALLRKKILNKSIRFLKYLQSKGPKKLSPLSLPNRLMELCDTRLSNNCKRTTLVQFILFLCHATLGTKLAIRFKITTGYMQVSLPRMLVYIRYVWT